MKDLRDSKLFRQQCYIDGVWSNADEGGTITVTVQEDGHLYWNDAPVTRDQLESQLSVEAQKTPQPEVNVRGDKTTKYRIVSDVVNIAQQQGIAKVGFVATKERP